MIDKINKTFAQSISATIESTDITTEIENITYDHIKKFLREYIYYIVNDEELREYAGKSIVSVQSEIIVCLNVSLKDANIPVSVKYQLPNIDEPRKPCDSCDVSVVKNITQEVDQMLRHWMGLGCRKISYKEKQNVA